MGTLTWPEEEEWGVGGHLLAWGTTCAVASPVRLRWSGVKMRVYLGPKGEIMVGILLALGFVYMNGPSVEFEVPFIEMRGQWFTCEQVG